MNRSLTPIAAAVALCFSSTAAVPADLSSVIGRRYQPITIQGPAQTTDRQPNAGHGVDSTAGAEWSRQPASHQHLPRTLPQDAPPAPRPFEPFRKVGFDGLNPFGPPRLIKVNDFDPTRLSPTDGVSVSQQPAPGAGTPQDLDVFVDTDVEPAPRATTPIPERRPAPPVAMPAQPAAQPVATQPIQQAPAALPQFGDLPLAAAPAPSAPGPVPAPAMINVDQRLAQLPPPPPSSPTGDRQTQAPQVGMASPRNLVVRTGQNQIIEVARFHLSRLVVPFAQPVIRTTSSADIEAKGQVLYISPQDDQPIALHITQEGNELQALVLTLLPKSIPPREVRISLTQEEAEVARGPVTPNTEAQQWETRHPYVTTIMRLLTATAEGKVPPGYRFRRYTHGDPAVFCADPNLKISPLQILEGHNLSLTVASVKNISEQDVTINELACHVPGVAAVSAYPRPFLRPGQVSELYVVNRKYPETASSRVRPSVIDPDYLRR